MSANDDISLLASQGTRVRELLVNDCVDEANYLIERISHTLSWKGVAEHYVCNFPGIVFFHRKEQIPSAQWTTLVAIEMENLLPTQWWCPPRKVLASAASRAMWKWWNTPFK